MTAALAILMSYVLGSVPFALLAARARGIDLRAHGSGNPGATNAIRVLGPGLGVPVLLADVGKGFAAVAGLPAWLGVSGSPESGSLVPLLCGAAVTAGHVAPVFLRFRGGKGVAAAGGAFLALAPAATGIAVGVFAVVLLAGRYVSLASMSAAVVLPVALWGTGAAKPVLGAGVAIGLLVVLRHRSNIARLLAGTENRIRLGKRKGGAR